MTDGERDALLIRLDERTKEIDKKLKNDWELLRGNGRPGLVDRVKELEDWRAARDRHYGAIAGIIGFIVNAAIAIYAIAKKIK